MEIQGAMGPEAHQIKAPMLNTYAGDVHKDWGELEGTKVTRDSGRSALVGHEELNYITIPNLSAGS